MADIGTDKADGLNWTEDLFEASNQGAPLPPLLSAVPPHMRDRRSPWFSASARFEVDKAGTGSSRNVKDDDLVFNRKRSRSYGQTTKETLKNGKIPDYHGKISDRDIAGLDARKYLKMQGRNSKDATKGSAMSQKHATLTQGADSTSSSSMASPASRRRHTSGKAANSLQEADHKELAFGPFWLGGQEADEEGSDSASLAQASCALHGNAQTKDLYAKLISRHSIAVDSVQPRRAEKEPNQSARRRTIAPIGSLDDQIRQRKNNRQVRSHTLPESTIQHDVEGSPVLARAATIESSISEEPEESLNETPSSEISVKHSSNPEELHKELADPESQSPSPITQFAGEVSSERRKSGSLPTLNNISPTSEIRDYSSSTTVSDMKSAFKKMRGRSNGGTQSFRHGPVKPTREEVSPDHLVGIKDTSDKVSASFSIRSSVDARKRSGSFGSKMLRRAKSAVGRPSRKQNEQMQNLENELTFAEKLRNASPRLPRAIFQKQISLNESVLRQANRRSSPPNDYSVMKPNANDGTFYEEVSFPNQRTVEAAAFPTVMMQGDLYRRKRLTWNKTWAVLTADRILTLYKTKEDFESSRKEWDRNLSSPTATERSSTMAHYQHIPTTLPSAKILSVINLSGGCEIEDVVQGKKSTVFQLIPHSYQAMSQGGAMTLPFEPGLVALNKTVHLMCKNNDEFLYWVKAFVQLNTNNGPPRQGALDGGSKSRESPLLRHHQKAPSPSEGSQSKRREKRSPRGSKPGMEGTELGAKVKDQHSPKREVKDSPNGADSPLDQLKYIDEDDDAEVQMSGVRVYSDVNNDEKPSLSPKTIFEITEPGKDKVATETVVKKANKFRVKDDKPIAQRSFRESKKIAEDLEKNGTDDDEELVKEFKRCSTTEKVDLRTAQIVGVHGGKSAPSGQNVDIAPFLKLEKDKHRRKDRHGKRRAEVERSRQTGESLIEDSDSKTSKSESRIEGGQSRREDSETSKTNKATRTREKQAREKGGARKKKPITDGSNCDGQIIQSPLPDKRSGGSSLVAPVYIGDKVAKENIRSGVGSVKDKQSESLDSNAIIQCEASKIRQNSSDLPQSESQTQESIADRNKRTSSPELLAVPSQNVGGARRKVTQDFSLSSPSLYKHSSVRQLKSRSKAYTTVRKQKSLRQKLLRKLGSKAALSNSTPDLNCTGETEDAVSLGIPALDLSLVATPVVNLRRNTAFRRDSSPLIGTRSLSEGDLLEAVEEEETDGRNMRTFKNVRKISQDNFIETYGVIPRKKNGRRMDFTKRHTTYETSAKEDLPGLALYADDLQDGLIHHSGNARRGSTSESNSSDSSYQASLTNSDPQAREVLESTRKASLDKCPSHGDIHSIAARKSQCSDDSGGRSSSGKEDSSRNSWLGSLTPYFGRKANKQSNSNAQSKGITGSRRAVFHIPASQLTSAAHRGYLDRRNKKRQWERFWCVLQDSCLYCYNSPQSECTVDAVVLRGYDVIADVTNMNRSRFLIRLERNGSPTYNFSLENHQQFILWVGTMEKETSNVLPAVSDNEVLVNSVKTTANTHRHDNEVGVRSQPVENAGDHETYETQKENLLREVLAQQQKLIEEQRRLHGQNSNTSLTAVPEYPSKRHSKDLVNEKYSRAKDNEELKIMKSLTHLNRRRNSAQLKVDQITKELAPKSGRKRRENPQQFAEMEEKLRELQERLATVDKEIQNKHVMRQDALEKIQQRRDLELLLLEQQENLAIIRKHQARMKRAAFAEQTQPDSSSERLASIDEMSSISDCSSTSSNSLPDPLTLGIDTRLQAMSTPRQNRQNATGNGATSEGDSCFHRSSDMDEVMSQSNSSIEGGLSDDFRSMSTSSEEDRLPRRTVSSNSAISMASVSSLEDQAFKKADEVHPSILAEIEDFQRFSKQKLAKLGSSE